MYYPDLSPYTYLGQEEPDTFTIGWLDTAKPFPTGDTPEEVRKRLLRLCATPIHRTRGWHACPFCDDEYPVRIDLSGQRVALGDGEIRVVGANGKRYAAPNLVCHYIDKHSYSPPDEFQRAVLDCQ
jgi:hypothetical protein